MILKELDLLFLQYDYVPFLNMLCDKNKPVHFCGESVFELNV